MNTPVWLIESGVFGSDADSLVKELRRQKTPCGSVAHRELVKDGPPIPPGECVIVYGTYPFVRHAQLHAGWIPGAWLDPDTFDCTTYAPHFGAFLLNARHEILRGVDAIRDADRLFAAFGPNDEVFARPTGVHKLFVGRCIFRDDWATALAPTRYDPDTNVLVAEPREIGQEWRLVVVGSEIVSACRYAVNGRKEFEPGCPPDVLGFAGRLLAAVPWRPADVFVLDVCESDGEFRVVEINPFETSGLYLGDLEAIVRQVSRAASEAWARAQPS